MKKIIDFIKETWQRFTSPSPTYFKIIQWISGITAFITGIPAILISYHVTLPPFLAGVENSVVAIAALVGYFVSRLTVKNYSDVSSTTKIP